MISRCSSPMPEMTTCPVSSSVRTRNVGSSSESRASALRELVLVGLRLGLDGQSDDGLGERDRLQQDRVRLVAQRVPGRDLLEADGGGDLAGADGLALLAAVGVHLEDAADALLAARRRVVDVRARLEHARVDAEVRQLADERVGHDLERERAERLVEARLALELLAGLRVEAVHGALVERRGQVVDDRVEQRLDALVLERGAAQDGRDREVERAGADRAAQARGVDLLVLEERHGDVVVVVGDGLDQIVARLGGGIGEIGRDLGLFPGVADRVGVADRLALDEVDDRPRMRPRRRSAAGSARGARRGGRRSTAPRRRSRRRRGPSC